MPTITTFAGASALGYGAFNSVNYNNWVDRLNYGSSGNRGSATSMVYSSVTKNVYAVISDSNLVADPGAALYSSTSTAQRLFFKRFGSASSADETVNVINPSGSDILYVTGYFGVHASIRTMDSTGASLSANYITYSGGYIGSRFLDSVNVGTVTYSAGFAYVATSGGSLYNANFIVTKYDSGSGLVWSRQLAISPSTNAANKSIGVDSSENVYVSGDYNAIAYGTGTGPNYLHLAKYNSSGTLQWAKQISDKATTNSGYGLEQKSKGIAVDSSGNCYVSFNNAGGSAQANPNMRCGLIKFDSAGAFVWALSIPYATYDNASTSAVTIGGDNNIYLAYAVGGATNSSYVAQITSSGTVNYTLSLSGYGNSYNSLQVVDNVVFATSGTISLVGPAMLALPSDGQLSGRFGAYTFAVNNAPTDFVFYNNAATLGISIIASSGVSSNVTATATSFSTTISDKTTPNVGTYL